MTAVALRPYVPADAKRCVEIFRSSIDELAADDYDEDQREAWASRADDEQAFAARLGEALTLLAVIAGAVAGFATSLASTVRRFAPRACASFVSASTSARPAP